MCVYIDIYVYIYDSFHCIAETNTTLQSNYTQFKKCEQDSVLSLTSLTHQMGETSKEYVNVFLTENYRIG